jgi:C1A family cysteine protease
MIVTHPGFGWKPDVPDFRDRDYEAIRKLALPQLPPEVIPDRSLTPRIFDQGQTMTCTACAVNGAVRFLRLHQGLTPVPYSRLFNYFTSGLLENENPPIDDGRTARDAVKAWAQWGCCDGELWPWDPELISTTPPTPAFQQAQDNQILSYYRINTRDLVAIKACLAEGYPVVFGFPVYDFVKSPVTTSSGIVYYPNYGDVPLGGHCVYAIGYSDAPLTGGGLLCVNSWGDGWGNGGWFWLDYKYVTNGLADDFWTIRTTEAP